MSLSAEVTLKWSDLPWLKFESDSQVATWYAVPSVPFPAVDLVETLRQAGELRDAIAPQTRVADTVNLELKFDADELEIEIGAWEVRYTKDNGTITQQATQQATLSLYEVSILLQILREWVLGGVV